MFGMQSRISRNLLSFLLFFTVYSSACVSSKPMTPEPTPFDIDWIEDSSCTTACWQGLQPGISSKTEALEQVIQLPFLSQDFNRIDYTLWDFSTDLPLPGELYGFPYQEPDGSGMGGVGLVFANDVLFEISFSPDQKITLGEIVNSMGAPDYFSYKPANPHVLDCLVSLFWIERQVKVTSYEKSKFGRNLCEEIKKQQNRPPATLPVRDFFLTDLYRFEEDVVYGTHFPWTGFADLDN